MKSKFSKLTKRIIAVILCISALFNTTSFIVSAAKDQKESVITISATTNEIRKGNTLQLTADVSNVTWSTSDQKIATVDGSGLVKGVAKGNVVITATSGKKTGSITLYVTPEANPVSDFLSNHALLSYKYRYRDDYYYVDAPNAWQRFFGFNKLYDLVAPYILLEYDYARVHFEYQGKDWMIQLWKGQYGMIFYGGEVGVYLKDHSDKEDTVTTTYKCADPDNWLTMQTNLYRDEKMNGQYVRQFSTPKEKTWWSTGFKPGHLIIEEPARELRLTGTITLKDKEMTEAFAEGLKECGFEQVKDKDSLKIDSFYVNGCDIGYSWQNLSYAENTMPIKIAGLLLINTASITAFIFGLLSLLGLAGIAILT